MTFSYFIQLNTVPEWSAYYLPYASLNLKISSILQENKSCLTESSALLQKRHTSITEELDASLANIIQFYAEKECEFNTEFDQILNLGPSPSPSVIIVVHDTCSSSSSTYLPLPPSIDQEGEDLDPAENYSPAVQNQGDYQESRLIELYISLCKLKSFVSVNENGFEKILKKYDKLLNSNLNASYMSNTVLNAYPFRSSTRQHLDDLIQQVQMMYNAIKEEGEKSESLDALLSERIQCDRNIAWKTHIGKERKTANIHIKETTVKAKHLKKSLVWAMSIAVFIYLLNCSLFEHIEQRRCFAVLVFSSLLWSTELMPLFVTALLVPFLVILLRVIRSEQENGDGTTTYTRLSAMDASKAVFASMLSPVIMLLLGGFSIAAALNKFGIAKALASFFLSKAGTKPSSVLFVNMLVASMASMWISNVAAPVLCLSLIQPILRTLPVGSPFAPCLIMGIALASNLGGIASPIASPQNVIAIQNMSPPPSWTDWFCVSVPLCLLGNSIVWLWLLYSYKIKNSSQITALTSTSSSTITRTQIYVICVTLFTIVLWCIARTYHDTLGDMGVIAIIPLIAFFGTGILTKDEFNNFLWNVIVLAMGGIALGKAVESSGLLHTIALHISEHVIGFSVFEVLLVFSVLVLVIATFISHTVAALIVLPIIAKIGSQLTGPEPRLLVMGAAFVCSAAMGLPVSGFPNMTAISQENVLGEPYLKTKDFLRNGVPCSILIMLCIVTFGYVLMSIVGI